MNIDKKVVQKLIEKILGNEFEISNVHNSSKYIFIDWKHKKYDVDDERGQRIGVGPVAFNKHTKEYKLLGSGEMINGDYMDYMNEGVEEYDDEIPNLEQIKSGILRRQYINQEDIGYLAHLLEQKIGKFKCYFNGVEELKEEPHEVLNTDNKEVIEWFIYFWNEIGFQCRQKSELKLILWKAKKPSTETSCTK